MKRTYSVEWGCNNSTFGHFESASLNDSKRTLSAILRGSTFIGSNGHGAIYELHDGSNAYGAPILQCQYYGGKRRVNWFSV